MQQESLTKNVGYLTDGFQFFGLSNKETNKPEVLSNEKFPNEVYQYEFAYTALQSERVNLSGESHFNFYGIFKEDHPTAITAIEYETDVLKLGSMFNYKTSNLVEALREFIFLLSLEIHDKLFR